MADNDPNKFRSMGGGPDRRDFDADEDPLVELARIVSEDGGFTAPKTERPSPAPARAADPQDDFSADLEAELMQELESSLRARQAEAPGLGRPTAPAAPARPAFVSASGDERGATTDGDEPSLREDPADLLRALEAQLGSFGHRIVAPAADEEDETAHTSTIEPDYGRDDDGSGDDADAEAFDDVAPRSAAPAEDPFRTLDPPSRDPFLEAEDDTTGSDAYEEGAANWVESHRAEPIAETGQRDNLRATGRDADLAAADEDGDWKALTASVGASGWASDTASDRSRRREVPPAQSVTSEASAPYAPRSASLRASRDAEPDPLVASDDPRAELRASFNDFGDSPALPLEADDRSGDRDLPAPALRADDIDDGDRWAEDDGAGETLAPPPAATSRQRGAAAGSGRRGSSRMALLLAGVVVLAAAGLGTAYLRSTNDAADGPPPVIQADERPVKAQPEAETAANDATAPGVVYTPPGTTAPEGERVVESAEEPREVARVVLPAPQEPSGEALERPVEPTEPPAATPPASEAASTPNTPLTPIGPRKVRTFVVRADGTVVTDGDAGATSPAATPAPAETPAALGDPLRANPVRTTPIPALSSTDGTSAPAIVDEVEALAGTAGPDVEVAAADPADTAPAEAESAAETPALPETGPTDSPEGATVPRARPTPPPASTEVAAVESPAPAAAADAPVDLLAGGPAPATSTAAPSATETAAADPASTPTGAGGPVVQVSSQRSEAAALSAFEALKRRHPDILGRFDANVQRADLGAKGTYYRARIGPMASRGDAIRLCEALQAAGGSCFVTE